MAIPPICPVCGSAFAHTDVDGDSGDWVCFVDYAPLVQPPDAEAGRVVIGDDDGKAYFCGQHLAAARARADKRLDEALAALQTAFASEPSRFRPEGPSRGPRGWIVRLFGFAARHPS